MVENQLVWREEVRRGDIEVVRSLCRSSGFFSEEEVELAVELVEEHLIKGTISGYHFLFAQQGDQVLGYACYGPVPATESSWDLYWMVVDEEKRGQGLGRRLQSEAERMIFRGGGRRIYIWTSSREQYQPTRFFYERLGYTAEATLHEYYAPGEHLVIYVKAVS
jgi:ribosomal protein S18 acetylase RimI-like enzyme